MEMDSEALKKILDDKDAKWDGDNAFKGLQIIAKYIDPEKKTILCGGAHDQIWSVSLDAICAAGLTEEDAQALAMLNWMEDEDSLSCFV